MSNVLQSASALMAVSLVIPLLLNSDIGAARIIHICCGAVNRRTGSRKEIR